jgi:hypothetical protein
VNYTSSYVNPFPFRTCAIPPCNPPVFNTCKNTSHTFTLRPSPASPKLPLRPPKFAPSQLPCFHTVLNLRDSAQLKASCFQHICKNPGGDTHDPPNSSRVFLCELCALRDETLLAPALFSKAHHSPPAAVSAIVLTFREKKKMSVSIRQGCSSRESAATRDLTELNTIRGRSKNVR